MSVGKLGRNASRTMRRIFWAPLELSGVAFLFSESLAAPEHESAHVLVAGKAGTDIKLFWA